jgi:hypothetical protein
MLTGSRTGGLTHPDARQRQEPELNSRHKINKKQKAAFHHLEVWGRLFYNF